MRRISVKDQPLNPTTESDQPQPEPEQNRQRRPSFDDNEAFRISFLDIIRVWSPSSCILRLSYYVTGSIPNLAIRSALVHKWPFVQYFVCLPYSKTQRIFFSFPHKSYVLLFNARERGLFFLQNGPVLLTLSSSPSTMQRPRSASLSSYQRHDLDVSANRMTYGPGGSYHFFTDGCTRAFVTGCFQRTWHRIWKCWEMFIPVECLAGQEDWVVERGKQGRRELRTRRPSASEGRHWEISPESQKIFRGLDRLLAWNPRILINQRESFVRSERSRGLNAVLWNNKKGLD